VVPDLIGILHSCSWFLRVVPDLIGILHSVFRVVPDLIGILHSVFRVAPDLIGIQLLVRNHPETLCSIPIKSGTTLRNEEPLCSIPFPTLLIILNLKAFS
jgi:hypothetical protein